MKPCSAWSCAHDVMQRAVMHFYSDAVAPMSAAAQAIVGSQAASRSITASKSALSSISVLVWM